MPQPAQLTLGSHCVAAAFIGDVAAFALADGTVHRVGTSHETKRVHDGLLVATVTPDGSALMTGGEDGRVCRTGTGGEPEELAAMPRKWITALAAGRNGAIAFASGRRVWVDDRTGQRRELQHSSAVEDLAFAPDGNRIAVAGSNGVALHPLDTGEPRVFEWPGLHTGIAFSPDGRFLVGPLREGGFHGWRIEDAQHLRMLGYKGKVDDWSWSADGKWLATSGATAAILWPFQERDGPIGKTPLEVGSKSDALVTAVACHPTKPAVALGDAHGAVLACPFDGAGALELRPPGGREITSLGWDRTGQWLAFGARDGSCGVAEFPSGVQA